MSNTANIEIRMAAKNAGIRLWQIAERFGVNDGNFSRKLRHELPPKKKKKILNIIDEMASEKAGVV